MKCHSVIAVAVLWFSSTAQAFDSQALGMGVTDAPVFSGRMQTCFVHAMLGMDSVINSRVGVPPEHVIALTARLPVDEDRMANGETRFDEPVLTLMLAAYLWQGSPHGYAVKVFYECAAAAPVMAERSDFLP